MQKIVERIVNADRVEDVIAVFGSFDENIRRIEESFGVGRAAAFAAEQGVSREMMVILRDSEAGEPYSSVFGHMDIDLIANKTKYVPKHYINERGNGITEACARYMLPLIEGETYPEYKCGMPVYFSFDK